VHAPLPVAWGSPIPPGSSTRRADYWPDTNIACWQSLGHKCHKEQQHCLAKDMDILIMDVEGTNGRECGKDQDFGRRSAPFSMGYIQSINRSIKRLTLTAQRLSNSPHTPISSQTKKEAALIERKRTP
ncbi:8082_t:CDS:2, partial [Paraglomus brasilianum]